MPTPQQAYEAFGHGDIQPILRLQADEVDWKFVGSSGIAYAGLRRNHDEIAKNFERVAQADDIHAFEPREYTEAGDYVVVPGFACVPRGKPSNPNGRTCSPCAAAGSSAGAAATIPAPD